MQLAVLGLRCGTQALKLAGSVVAACKLRCFSVWGLSSSTRDWTYVPCIARWILNHWTTKEGPQRKFLMHLGVSCSCLISMLILNHVLPQRRLRMFSACCSTPHWNHLDNCQQLSLVRGFPGWCSGKESPCQWKETQEMWVQSLGREDPLEEEMATHSFSCLGNPMDRGAWWATVHGVTQTEEPGRLLCVSHTHTHTHTLSLCLSLSLSLSVCLSLYLSLCLSLSLFLSLPVSLSLYLSLLIWGGGGLCPGKHSNLIGDAADAPCRRCCCLWSAAAVVMASLWAERVSGPSPCNYRLRSPWSILSNSYLHRTLEQRARVRGVLLYAPPLSKKQRGSPTGENLGAVFVHWRWAGPVLTLPRWPHPGSGWMEGWLGSRKWGFQWGFTEQKFKWDFFFFLT